MMVGGDRGVFERVEPVLRAIGPKVTYIGASGLAVQLKLAINHVLIVEVIAFCEGVALAEKGGIPREVAVDAMLKSVVASPVLAYRARSSSTAACPRCRSPTSTCSRRTSCSRSRTRAGSARRRRSAPRRAR